MVTLVPSRLWRGVKPASRNAASNVKEHPTDRQSQRTTLVMNPHALKNATLSSFQYLRTSLTS